MTSSPQYLAYQVKLGPSLSLDKTYVNIKKSSLTQALQKLEDYDSRIFIQDLKHHYIFKKPNQLAKSFLLTIDSVRMKPLPCISVQM